MMHHSNSKNYKVAIVSDTSGTWGCEAFYSDKLQRPEAICNDKKLVSIVSGAAVWGSEWKGLNIMSHYGNATMVTILNKGDSKETEIMHFIQCHISGAENILADALSRGNRQYFLSHSPQAQHRPTPLPPELLDHTP